MTLSTLFSDSPIYTDFMPATTVASHRHTSHLAKAWAQDPDMTPDPICDCCGATLPWWRLASPVHATVYGQHVQVCGSFCRSLLEKIWTPAVPDDAITSADFLPTDTTPMPELILPPTYFYRHQDAFPIMSRLEELFFPFMAMLIMLSGIAWIVAGCAMHL